jgi:hypothetical protein
MRAARFITFAVVLAVLASISLSTAYAQAYDVSFTTAITYQNVGDDTAHIVAEFYESPSDTTPIEITRPDLAAGASTSLYIGGLSEIADGFQGSATLLSDQPLLATTVQLPQGSPIVKNRPLSNGFTAGASQVLVATVLKNTYDTTSIFSIQNASSEERTLTLRFYNTSATEVYSDTQSVQPGAAYLFDAGQATGLGSSFNGSAVVQATGDIVGSAMELSTNSGGTACSAFEGVAAGASQYYMPSALCQAWGSNTAYAVQNTSLTNPTDVTVTYSNGASETQTINPGAKRSFIACNATGMTTGFSGSATVESSATDVIAIGKAYGSGLSTAFVGASSGTSKVALPYVRWGTDAEFAAGNQQRTFITVQNIGSTDLNAGDVTVQYIKYDGTVEGTDSLDAIAVESKVNSNASEAALTSFGIYGSTYGGGAIVEGPPGSELAVVARVSTQVSAGTYASEDYNGMAVP